MLDRSSRSLPRIAGHGYEQVGRGEQQRHRQAAARPRCRRRAVALCLSASLGARHHSHKAPAHREELRDKIVSVGEQ